MRSMPNQAHVIANSARHNGLNRSGRSSPVNSTLRLSSEILALIFIRATRVATIQNELYGVSLSNVVDSLDTALPPWTVMLVCKRWFEIASSTPHLWNIIGIDLDLPNSNHGSPRHRRLQDVLAYSQGKPLFLTIMNREGRERGTRDALLELLMRESWRWKELEVALRADTFHALSPIAGNLGMLRKIDVKHTEKSKGRETEDDKYFTPCNVFHQAPSLTEVIQFGFQNTLVTLPMPWSQLKELRTMYCDILDGLHIMKIAHDTLEVCYLNELHYAEKGQIYSAGPISMSKLRRFYMILAEEAIDEMACHLPSLYSNLAMPVVDCIQLSCPEFIPYTPTLSGMLIRSGAKLRVLDLHMKIPPYAVIDVLRYMPVLETLALYQYEDDIFRALTYPFPNESSGNIVSEPTALAPSLKNLQISWPWTSLNAFSTMVKSRWNTSPNDANRPVRLEYILVLQSMSSNPRNHWDGLRRLMTEIGPGFEIRTAKRGIFDRLIMHDQEEDPYAMVEDSSSSVPASSSNGGDNVRPEVRWGGKTIPGLDPDKESSIGLLTLEDASPSGLYYGCTRHFHSNDIAADDDDYGSESEYELIIEYESESCSDDDLDE